MDDLISDFVAETRDTLEGVAGAMLQWERCPDDLDHLDEVFRFVHTVKGSCGFLQLPRIAALADAAETVLADLRDGRRVPRPSLVAALLAVIDRIGLLAAALETPGSNLPAEAGDRELTQALDRDDLIDALFKRPSVVSPRSVAVPGTVRIAVPLLDEIMTQLSDVLLIRNEMAQAVRALDDPQLTRALDRLTGAVGSLRDSVTRTRMQPVAKVFAALPRLVRDTATELGKQVTLEISGHDVEIDREMGDAIRDPLLHIIRNAIDHGIESPQVRRAAGKPVAGLLRVIAWQAGNQIGIEVRDDGRGIDTSALVARAIAAGRLDPVRAERLDDRAAIELVFEPGLSTAQAVSRVSGRGVGMDVVRANVGRLGGTVQVANDPGQGLAVTLRAPLTLSLVVALTVGVGEHRFAIARASIEEIVPLAPDKARLECVGGAQIAVVRGMVLPAITLSNALGLRESEANLLLIVTTPDRRRCAIAVSVVYDHEELVMRAMAPPVAACGLFAGQSLDENGVPIVLLDAAALVALAGGGEAIDQCEPHLADESRETVLLAEALDGRRIAVRTALIDRLVKVSAKDCLDIDGDLFVRIDGSLCPTVPVARDAELPPTLIAMLLHDDNRQAVLPVTRADDVVSIGTPVFVGKGMVEAILEQSDGPALLLDGFALLSVVAPARKASRPVAVIVLPPSAWTRGMLAPLLEAAGYQVSFEPHDAAALTVTLEGDASFDGQTGVVALRSNGTGAVAVEHYDRATLVRAISHSARAE